MGELNEIKMKHLKEKVHLHTLELRSVVGVDSGRGGLLDTRKLKGSYK